MRDRLTIVHLTTYLQGGAGRAITDLACAQRAAGHRVLVVSSATSAPGYGNYPHYIDRLHKADVSLILEDSLFTRDTALNLRVLDRLKTAGPSGRDRHHSRPRGHPGANRIGLRAGVTAPR